MDLVYHAPERIDGVNASAVQDEMETLVSKAINGDYTGFVMDMSDTAYLSSAGLRVIGFAQKRVRAGGGTFVLRNVSEKVKDLLDVTGLSGYLTIE